MDAVSIWAEVSFPSVLQGVQQVSRLHDYIIAPLNGLVDERYTIYFDGILNPSDHRDLQEWRDIYFIIKVHLWLIVVFILYLFILIYRLRAEELAYLKKKEEADAAKPYWGTSHASYAEYISWAEGRRKRISADQKPEPSPVKTDLPAIRAEQSAQVAQTQLPGVSSSSSKAAAFASAANTSSIRGSNGNVVANDGPAEASDLSLGSGMPMHTTDGGVMGAGECKGGSGPTSESSFYMLSGSDLLASDED